MIPDNFGLMTRAALPSHCSSGPCDAFVDASVFETANVAIGMFRCPVRYRSFRDTGPIERHIVVFPRTAVWIRHAGSRPFLADPSVTTIYNAAQRYERFAESPDGDRCDWFGVSDDLAREIVSAFDVRAAEATRPFRFECAESPAGVYLRQRLLLRRAAASDLDPLEAEEAVIGIVGSVMALAYRAPTRAPCSPRHRQLAEAARVELSRSIRENRSVHDIARAVGTSPFHLCRVFRSVTGRTLHRYRIEVRLRLALERLEDAACTSNLSAIAHDLGFSSHAHFVRAMREHLGAVPSSVRAQLAQTDIDRFAGMPREARS